MKDLPSDFTPEKAPETLFKLREHVIGLQNDFGSFAGRTRERLRDLETGGSATAAKVAALSDRIQAVAAWSAGVGACLSIVLALLLSLGKLWVIDVAKPLIREEIARHEQMYEGKHPANPSAPMERK